MSETQFTLVACDAPMGYITRVTPSKYIDLPEEAEGLTDQLLSILKAVCRARKTMEQTNRKFRREVLEIDEQSEVDLMIIGSSFDTEANSNKRRSDGERSEDQA
ncbi:hypothetical protein BD560DRAFT_473023 [Blakeslea trispora]|nr:hypothetical protein BD560DRAFT_473023 [Blakeslea trispora]